MSAKVYGLDSSLIHDASPKDGFVVDVVRFSDYAELEKKYLAVVAENAALTDKAASELSNSWLLHRAVMAIQAALHCIHGTNIYEAQCWLESIADDAELVIPPEMMLSDLQRWFDENMTGLITHAKAVEIIKSEAPVTTQALNEIKAQGVEELAEAFKSWADDGYGDFGAERHWAVASKEALSFAASLRGE